MHLLVRESHALDDTAQAVDLEHGAAELIFLSFSDSDLGAAASAWEMLAVRPTLRLANLNQLRHPMSVDMYLEKTIAQARCVVIRLLGGLDYWRYGAEEIAALCQSNGIALAIIPGDERADPRLSTLSTVDETAQRTLADYFRYGGPANIMQALRYAARLGGLESIAPLPPELVPLSGFLPAAEHFTPGARTAVIIFYRSHLLAGDIAPILALAAELSARGLTVQAIYVDNLKNPETCAFVETSLRRIRPVVILNTTAFSARHADRPSPLDAADAPVIQAILAGSSRTAWEASSRGLNQADLAMNIVLPELDGRLLSCAISHKNTAVEWAELGYVRTLHEPDPDGIMMTANTAAGWARLATTPPQARELAIILANYPGNGGQYGYAVGLDSFASLETIIVHLASAGYNTGAETIDAASWPSRLRDDHATPYLSLAAYEALFAGLPASLQERVVAAWGAADTDPDIKLGFFTQRFVRVGGVLVTIQPERGSILDRKASYHDPDLPPRHGYIAFYLWLTRAEPVHAILNLGAHGTLEWLPGKAVSLSAACFPTALLGGVPVIYPFIVNDPGEAAAAKRRLGAVVIGHLTPASMNAGLHGEMASLETLIDEYAAADGLDGRRTKMLRTTILERATALGLTAEAGIDRDTEMDDALARLSAHLCDIKDMQIRDGLHIFGRAPQPARRDVYLHALATASPAWDGLDLAARFDASPEAELQALLAALDGRLVAPGPAGAPTRGRIDVMPTGRNLYTVDPRSIPTRSAVQLAERTAKDLLRRHMQDHGDCLRRIVMDLWGSASMRTGGEDLALALTLMGVVPLWDSGSSRVNGFEILPLALLDRPRVDVTLRISGLFRDAFGPQIDFFDQAVNAVAARDESEDWNPLAKAARGGSKLLRIYGPAPGDYGAGITSYTDAGAWETRKDLATAYLAASSFSYGLERQGDRNEADFSALVGAADAYLHVQDHAETDILDGTDQAAHIGGFAAAADWLGASPSLYHADTSQPEIPRLRAVADEVARVVRGRASNPAWLAGMRRHGYSGASEITRGVEALFVIAASLSVRFDAQFEQLFEAILGDETTDQFLRAHNPQAREAMIARFEEARLRGLWRPRSNSFAQRLETPS